MTTTKIACEGSPDNGWPFHGRITRGERQMIESLIIFLLIGAVAGWLAGQIMGSGGFGLVGDVIVGVIGAVIGGWLFGVLGIAAGGIIGAIICATVGAIILIVILRAIKRA
jgi:uncharacterized membrane protein YeaQ/YmgE (transglycosylase-associated protein family)